MVCIYCEHKTKVNNSRTSVKAGRTWRRRECLECHSVFTTREQAELDGAISVLGTNDALQPFSRDKLFISLHRSLSHRKKALSDAGELADTIITRLLNLQIKGALKKELIVTTSTEVLNRFDVAAGTHYTAHHS